ncbi:aminoglycoside 3-N-acetyltransferase [Paenibacillus cellulosilyticus]|uniref:Aminoglycoside N(3)-acetyltransferase n=1 Tax=Paenibacillus cellulosilyticus TaxID=375489 RepID=A0A2V2YM13_9BACL|nr:AAC(3) family N-acetyltransferase [Paenibacillus cellulosilyticus]PWV95241.1 aminoglycoside 3-N-acetyltransferase [Paenibacillus cellulosilyticus]QKS46013.1 AAC(3) family N-acetyltransferase [Paenibacillus cellulosilyticus]
MSEKDVVDQTSSPITVTSLVHDLRQLGLQPGDQILVHSSLSSMGWVCGGAQAVIQALLEVVGEEGTIIMPAQSTDWSDPAEWALPPVPKEWIDIIYREMPAFDPAITPTRCMGRIAELFRTYPRTIRSNHPQVSFCANGKHAAYLMAGHPLTPQFGSDSPLGKLYEINAKVLLLGVDYDSCTSFHLAETMLSHMPTKQMGTAMIENGERAWKWFTDYAYDSDDFIALGEQYEAQHQVKQSKIGQAVSKVLELQQAIPFATDWLKQNRIYEQQLD